MNNSRIENTKRNIIVSYISVVITFILSFVYRTVMLKFLGSEYLGLSSLFVSILSVLNMAELGFAGAIVFNMYKPLAENDTDTVCMLLGYYRKIYGIIGITILIVGVAITPLIPQIITGKVPVDINLYVLYLLYLINTSISYFLFAYKNSLLEALQRMDLIKIVSIIVNILQYLIQILSIIVLKNFYIVVIVQILCTAISNVVIGRLSSIKYPQYKCKSGLSTKTINDIKVRVKGLMICKVSGITYTTFDSIIISAFIGLQSVAIYNNYLVIFNAISSVILMLRNAMQASVGNSIASENKNKNYQNLILWQYMFSFIATICGTCLLCLYQPFMKVWMGEQMLLPMYDVILICIWFFVTVIQHSYYLYLTGAGLWWEMRNSYIFSTIFNIVCNFILGKIFGITGIILSTLLAQIIFGLIWQSNIIFREYFNSSIIPFAKKQTKYFMIMGIVCIFTYFVSSKINIQGWIGLIVKAVVSILLSTILSFLLYQKIEEFYDAKILFKRVLKR